MARSVAAAETGMKRLSLVSSIPFSVAAFVSAGWRSALCKPADEQSRTTAARSRGRALTLRRRFSRRAGWPSKHDLRIHEGVLQYTSHRHVRSKAHSQAHSYNAAMPPGCCFGRFFLERRATGERMYRQDIRRGGLLVALRRRCHAAFARTASLHRWHSLLPQIGVPMRRVCSRV